MPPSSFSGHPIEGRRVTFIVPGSIEARTGGYEYDRRIVSGLRAPYESVVLGAPRVRRFAGRQRVRRER